MDANRESRQTDIAMMIAGLIFPAGGFLIMNQDTVHYLPGDIRGEPIYGQVVFAVSIVLGACLFLIGLVRLVQSGQNGRG